MIVRGHVSCISLSSSSSSSSSSSWSSSSFTTAQGDTTQGTPTPLSHFITHALTTLVVSVFTPASANLSSKFYYFTPLHEVAVCVDSPFGLPRLLSSFLKGRCDGDEHYGHAQSFPSFLPSFDYSSQHAIAHLPNLPLSFSLLLFFLLNF